MNLTASADTSSAGTINVSFWYNDDDCDLGDAIWSWNNSDGNWIDIGNISAGDLGGGDDTWYYHSVVSSEAQYKHVGFAIRFWAGVDQNENYWIDNINISYTAPTECNPTLNEDWDISDAQVCDAVQVTTGTGNINILPGGTLTLANGANVSTTKLNLLTTGDQVFINPNCELSEG